MHTFELQT